jgi:hypothetical protein
MFGKHRDQNGPGDHRELEEHGDTVLEPKRFAATPEDAQAHRSREGPACRQDQVGEHPDRQQPDPRPEEKDHGPHQLTDGRAEKQPCLQPVRTVVERRRDVDDGCTR